MASGANSFKQSHGYFIPLADCRSAILNYSGAGGAGGSFLPGNFVAATWNDTDLNSRYLSTLSSMNAGGILRDMGKTVVSSNRTFRKVQLVAPSLAAGVVGSAATSGDYLTGYIELGWEGAGTPAPVARAP